MESWEAKQAIRAEAAAKLRAQHPELVSCAGISPLIAAAKNIRRELAAAFPAVKFAVRTKRFSMGNSLDVSWIDGPTSAQVDAIINCYSSGSFDSSTDCYNYERSGWTDAFGEAKYVHTRREYSDAMVANVMGRVCRYFGGLEIPSVEDFRKGRTWRLISKGGCDVGHEISIALQKHTFSIDQRPAAKGAAALDQIIIAESEAA